ncbi:uncharacterized protein A1O5_12933 [Cladophialophora psammophila CBS 110553]|uniref:Uncharacterized protein n=1 Tax=Cladophialophora psammophila CBS 110553 TaxID=1182543 RepID=W9VGX7_9EURO|nr:uncharacterized protein A1O5_12933 [Cladophialophora psammophila CBS 110553]EXJ54867.1 hypothetical protein A1O5_12933 [Cladophialophora psammophila CBS 110553]
MRYWTKPEELLLCDILDSILSQSTFSTFVQLTAEVRLKFQDAAEVGESVFTKEQITNKIVGLGRTHGLKPDTLLRNWADYGPKMRSHFEGGKRKSTSTYPPQTDNTLNEGSTFNLEDLGESTAQGDGGETLRPSLSNGAGQSSRSAPTSSSPSDTISVDFRDDEAERTPPVHSSGIQLEEWELQFLLHLREQRGSTGYEPPLPKRHIQNVLQKTMQQIDETFVHVMLGTRIVMPTSSRLTGEPLELTRLLVDSPTDGQTERRLKALIAGPHMSERTLFRAYTAAAIYEWALKSFDANLAHIPSSDYNHEIARGVSVKRVNQYIDKVIRPALSSSASELQEKLYNVFISISAPAVREGKSAAGEGFEFQDRQLRQWQERVQTGLLELLDTRATMAKCSLLYGFRLPAVGHPFEAEWMEPAHPEDQAFGKSDLVYVCLRPAVFAHDRNGGVAPPVLVSPALVMLEGYEPDLTMT